MEVRYIYRFITAIGIVFLQTSSQKVDIKEADDYKDARIVNGQVGGPHFPYFAQICMQWKYLCGGSIISDHAILTAASCIGTNPSDYKIYVGSSKFMQGDRYSVSEIIHHSVYRTHYDSNDIGLMLTREKILFSDNVQMIHLVQSDASLTNKNVLILGFGSVKEEFTENSWDLNRALVTVISNKDCKEILESKLGLSKITDRQFCTQSKKGGPDACVKDEGGPAVFEDEIVGIISWGLGCSRSRTPRVFTYVPAYIDWIYKHIGSENSKYPCENATNSSTFYTVPLVIDGFTRCVCTILSNHAFLSVRLCMPNADEAITYTIYHQGNHRIRFIAYGDEMMINHTHFSHDFVLIVTDKIDFEKSYKVPFLTMDSPFIETEQTGHLFKTFIIETRQTSFFNNLQNIQEPVKILPYKYCDSKFSEFIPFELKQEHFCVISACYGIVDVQGVCSDIPSSVVLNYVEELIGIVVWEGRCYGEGLAVALHLPAYLMYINKTYPSILNFI